MHIGKSTWVIPDCYWPEITTPGHYCSHEAVCVLNTGEQDAIIHLTLYFEDREPMGDFTASCPAMRTNHIRLDKLLSEHGQPIPQGVPYSIVAVSNVPVVCQYSRLDTTQPNETLMTTIAY